MRLSFIFIFAALLQVSASTRAQKVSIQQKNISLEQVFKQIRIQAGYNVLFNGDLIKNAKPIHINVKEAEVTAVMDLALANQDLTYSIKDKTIILEKKEPSFLEHLAARWAVIDIRGKVVDAEGKPLPGASVKVKNSGKSESANAKGEFFLRNVEEGAVLVISFIGYENKEVKASADMGNIALVLSDNILDQVQVIAYGTTSRRLSTGNVSTVKAEDIAKQPVSNPLLTLQGRVPGLVVTQQSGLPGASFTVRIQGQNSIGKGNDPFYVVDGVPYPSQLPVNNAGDIIPFGGGNPMNYINPADIESISILKDADATAIYGSRAANGAVIITTKKGKAGVTEVDFNLQQGFGKVTRRLDLLNTHQYIEMRNEAIKNDGNIPSLDNGDYDLMLWDTNRYTDWQKELIGGISQYTNLNGNISGGTETTQFLLGGTFLRESTVFPGNFDDKKGTIHFFVTNSSLNKRFNLQLTGNYQIDVNKLPGIDLTQNAIQLAPNSPALYNSDGSLNWAPNVAGSSTWENPLRYLNVKYENKTNNLISSLLLRYSILPSLEIKSTFGYNYLTANDSKTTPLIYFSPETRLSETNGTLFGDNNIASWIIEPQISYKQKVAKGNLEILVGSTINKSITDGLRLNAMGFNTDLSLNDISSAALVTVASKIRSIYKYNAVFGRVGYNWQDEFLLNLTARRDGSSRFGNRNLFHDFASIAGAWIFSQENFIRQNLSFISFGKLKFSFGTTGNDQIGDYEFVSRYENNNVDIPYQGTTALKPNGLANPYLKWEETKKMSIGLDLGFLKDRLLFTANYNHNRSSNQLINYVLPIITGFNSITKNLPATVQNSGIELALSSKSIQTKNFTWSSNINLTIPKNKLIAFPDLINSNLSNSLVIGQPLNIIKVIRLSGVDPITGLYQFFDKNGELTFNPNPAYLNDNDANIVLNLDPKYYGGFQNNFKYKKLELDILFQFNKGIGGNSFGTGALPGSKGYNQYNSVLNRWQEEGDHKQTQRYNADFSHFLSFFYANSYSDASFSDASYIRLKNLSLSWQLPEIWCKNTHLKTCNIYLLGQNLLTITNYKGLDPENKLIVLPPLKVITLGLRLSL
jgi:TonB-linked SusC/RagA family outer membrane protein